MFIENIDSIINHICYIIESNNYSIFDIESYDNKIHYRIYLKTALPNLDKNSMNFFCGWFSFTFNYLADKYKNTIKSDGVLLEIKNEIINLFKYLNSSGKLQQSFYDYYFFETTK